VAKDEFCRVVNNKGYKVTAAKCASTNGSAKEAAACKCGYKTTFADVAKDKFCFEDAAGKGYVADNKQCAALNANQADGSTIASAACTCGTAASTTCGFCFDDDNYVGKAAMSACSKTDGSTAHATAPEKCICGTSACATGKFCFAASVAGKCRATALPACAGGGKNDGTVATDADCKCGTAQAVIGKFCIAAKNAVNDKAIAACAGTDGKTAVAAGTACQCDASKDICVAGNFCDKTAAGVGNNKAKGSCLTTKKADPTPAPTPTPAKAPSPSSYGSGGTTPAPTPAPAHYIETEIKLEGITAADFNDAAKTAFKDVVSAKLGVKASDVYDLKVTDARRAGVKVSFKVKVKDAAAASSGATTLNTFLKDTGDNGFLKKLQAKGGNLAKVTKLTVTKAPAAKTSTQVSGVAKTAVVSLTSLVALTFAFLQ